MICPPPIMPNFYSFCTWNFEIKYMFLHTKKICKQTEERRIRGCTTKQFGLFNHRQRHASIDQKKNCFNFVSTSQMYVMADFKSVFILPHAYLFFLSLQSYNVLSTEGISYLSFRRNNFDISFVSLIPNRSSIHCLDISIFLNITFIQLSTRFPVWNTFLTLQLLSMCFEWHTQFLNLQRGHYTMQQLQLSLITYVSDNIKVIFRSSYHTWTQNPYIWRWEKLWSLSLIFPAEHYFKICVDQNNNNEDASTKNSTNKTDFVG